MPSLRHLFEDGSRNLDRLLSINILSMFPTSKIILWIYACIIVLIVTSLRPELFAAISSGV
jgi:hypothetical protein